MKSKEPKVKGSKRIVFDTRLSNIHRERVKVIHIFEIREN